MKDVKRDGFTFYKSFYESISEFSIEEQKDLYRYIIEYALLDINPQIDNKILNSIFRLIKPNIDSSIKKYDQRKKARIGKTKQERKDNEKKTKTSNNNKNNINNKITIKNNNSNNNPSITDIRSYIETNQYNTNANEFYNHYLKKNWKDKNGNIINYKKMIDYWERQNMKEQIDIIPKYDPSLNDIVSKEDEEEILAKLGRKDNVYKNKRR